jgi:hypothetical protein
MTMSMDLYSPTLHSPKSTMEGVTATVLTHVRAFAAMVFVKFVDRRPRDEP